MGDVAPGIIGNVLPFIPPLTVAMAVGMADGSSVVAAAVVAIIGITTGGGLDWWLHVR